MSVNLIETIENLGVPEIPEERERFRIETKDQAAWRDEENGKLERNIYFFECLLRDYFVGLRESDPKLKTLKLPHGALKMRAQQPQYEYDEDTLLPWAKENLPDAVVVKESVAKTPVKKRIQETGEVVPGVLVMLRPEKFSVEVVV
jgi:hypothetical protein